MRCFLLASVTATSILSGCVDGGDPPTASSVQDLIAANGVSLNGVSLNGVSLNGVNLNGVSLNGVNLNGVNLNGHNLNGVNLNGVNLNGVNLNGVNLNGTDFIGATLGATLSNGASAQLRIDDIDALTGDNADVLAYEVSVSTDAGWIPLCGVDGAGAAIRAVPVAGVWNLATGAWSDTGEITFACRAASIAKCVEIGYKPWLGYDQEHLACVRMLRADYCGDGVAHTVNGTPINIYDHAGVQVDTEAWPVDAEWTPDGAACVNHYRGSAEPSCFAEKYSASCGSFASGSLLIDEYAGT